jgi:acetyl esterase/lipase
MTDRNPNNHHNDNNSTNCFRSWCHFVGVTLPIIILYDGVGLFCYTILLLPAFVRMAYYYFVTANRTVVFYDSSRRSVRQSLDIYWPVSAAVTQTTEEAHSDRDDPAITITRLPPSPNRSRSYCSCCRGAPRAVRGESHAAADTNTSSLEGDLLLWHLHNGHADFEWDPEQNSLHRSSSRCCGGRGSAATAAHAAAAADCALHQRLSSDPRPILFFVCGGAWMIGYKMWGALLARILTQTGMTVILPDYRNYPFWGTVPDQIQDVETALRWTFRHISTPPQPSSSLPSAAASTNAPTTSSSTNTNGTPVVPSHYHNISSSSATPTTQFRRQVIVVGQSTGGHLLMTLLLRKLWEQVLPVQPQPQPPRDTPPPNSATVRNDTFDQPPTNQDNPTSTTTATTTVSTDTHNSCFDPMQYISGMIILSAPLDLQDLYTSTFRKHGLHASFVERMFHPHTMNEYNPMHLLQQIMTHYESSSPPQQHEQQQPSENPTPLDQVANAGVLPALRLPPIKVYHGSADRTVPYRGSIRFVEKLQQLLQSLDPPQHHPCDENDPMTTPIDSLVVPPPISSPPQHRSAPDEETDVGLANHPYNHVSFHLYDHWSHTDPILEGPMDADHRFHYDIYTTVREWCTYDDDDDIPIVGDGSDNDDPNNNNESVPTVDGVGSLRRPNQLQWPDQQTSPIMRRLCPHFLIQMSRFCMPF